MFPAWAAAAVGALFPAPVGGPAVPSAAPAAAVPAVQEPAPKGAARGAKFELDRDLAVRRGIEFLLQAQAYDGSYDGLLPQYGAGTTSLVAYVLLKCGLGPDHPTIQRALAYVDAHPADQVYTVALELMLRQAVDAKAQAARLRALTKQLFDWKVGEGWAYPNEYNNGVWNSNTPPADFSNLHFAVFGLKAAEAAGVDLPKNLWNDLAQMILGYLGPEELAGSEGTRRIYSRGILYRRGESEPRSAMTAAGAALLRLCIYHGDLSQRNVRRAEDGIESIKAWLDAKFAYDKNVGAGGFVFYNLMALERAASLNGWEEIGGRPWYEVGATHLMSIQQPEGSWRESTELGYLGSPASDTALALLFLKRASRPTTGQGAVAPPADNISVEGPERRVSLRILARQPLICTLVDFERNLRQAADAGPAGGLRVVEVEWYLDGQRATSLPGDATRPWAGDRFGAALELDRRGKHRVQARVRYVTPEAPAEAIEPTEWIESEEVEVDVLAVLEPWMLGCAGSVQSDQLAQARAKGQRMAAIASSKNKNDAPERVLDRIPSTLWLADHGDTEPTLELRFDKGIRADTLVLFPAAWQHAAEGSFDRPTRLEIHIDRVSSPLIADQPPDYPLAPWRIDLGKSRKIDRLELRIVGREPGSSGLIGFSDVGLELNGR